MKFLLAPLVFFLLIGSVFAKPGDWQDRREAHQDKKEERLASISARKEAFQTRKEERMASFSAIRDAKKQEILAKIEDKLNKINERRTDHFLKVLARLREILAKIQSRSDRAEANGKNVATVDTAIAAAQAAIDTAETAVNAQADKIYKLTVDDETTARNDVGAALKKLQEDLRGVWQIVQDARKAVFAALRALVAIVGTEGGTATPSATPT